ncbi:hypothetical protein ABIB62_001298 [Mucilaginibacter sp. UYP25]|uniref:hypothetical protein n=1 Tax=unclassified Mucilaginibacter TaxID=2617802 RepID=UPI003397EC65
MRIGVISEGHADRAVISNILTGLTGLDISAFEALRPIYTIDETDKAYKSPQTFSSWSVVKEECENRELIDGFLAFEGQDFIVIHIDSDKAHEYGIVRPDKKSETYCEDLRGLIILEINEAWFKEDLSESILYAIAIEEIDAWILAIFEDGDTSKPYDAKGRLVKLLNKKGINTASNYDNYYSISKPLSKVKVIERGKYLDKNCSLKAFYEEIETKVLPKLQQEIT